MIMGYMCVFFQPIGKFIWNGRKDLKDLMLFKCWSPVPLDKTWGLAMILVLETVAQFFPFFMYSAIATYMITMTILFYHQTDLIGEALATIEKRAWRMTWLKTDSPEGSYDIYTEILQQEISNCAQNYQNLYKWVNKILKICNDMMQ